MHMPSRIHPYSRHGCASMCKTHLPQIYLTPVQEVFQQMSEEEKPSQKGWSARIGELGPAEHAGDALPRREVHDLLAAREGQRVREH